MQGPILTCQVHVSHTHRRADTRPSCQPEAGALIDPWPYQPGPQPSLQTRCTGDGRGQPQGLVKQTGNRQRWQLPTSDRPVEC